MHTYSVFLEPIAEKMYGVHIKVFGYKGKLDDRCILIMNHRCHLDWFFLWGFVAKLGNLSIWKTVMKRELRSIPVFGMNCPLYGLVYDSLCMHTMLSPYWVY